MMVYLTSAMRMGTGALAGTGQAVGAPALPERRTAAGAPDAMPMRGATIDDLIWNCLVI
jgi:hypothetical protein